MIRLDKFLAENNGITRRMVKRLLHSGKIAVNGIVCRSADSKIDRDCALVTVDGKPVVVQHSVHIMLHKPAGTVTAVTDDRYTTVIDILPEQFRVRPVFPVGRLDLDTEGLLIITDDGILSHRLISPKTHVPKTYYVRLAQPYAADYADRFTAGITLADGTVCRPAVITPDESDASGCGVFLSITEGKYHQVKRMFAAIGNHVEYLRRTQIGTLQLDPQLKPGEMRLLTAEEVAALTKDAGL